jgi:hypothetical protein
VSTITLLPRSTAARARPLRRIRASTDNLFTQQYDNYKVEAVINWINGHRHDGSGNSGTPAIFGMNFQTVSTAQSTAIIVSARHGQSPMNLAALNRIKDSQIIAALNTAWKSSHPGAWKTETCLFCSCTQVPLEERR